MIIILSPSCMRILRSEKHSWLKLRTNKHIHQLIWFTQSIELSINGIFKIDRRSVTLWRSATEYLKIRRKVQFEMEFPVKTIYSHVFNVRDSTIWIYIRFYLNIYVNYQYLTNLSFSICKFMIKVFMVMVSENLMSHIDRYIAKFMATASLSMSPSSCLVVEVERISWHLFFKNKFFEVH